MTEAISPEIFDRLVELAALELTPAEAAYLRQQLNHQLDAIDQLESIPLDASLPITSHGVPYTAQISQPPREDAWQPYPAPEEILAQSPQFEDGYIIVPDIPHTSLE